MKSDRRFMSLWLATHTATTIGSLALAADAYGRDWPAFAIATVATCLMVLSLPVPIATAWAVFSQPEGSDA